MRKVYTIPVLILFLLSFWNLTAQTLVSTDPLPKNVVIEKFGGLRCGYCPRADALAQVLKDTYPNRVVVINIHQGEFAEPHGDEPDYRTIWGDSIAELAGVYAYPVGTINRHLFDDDITAMSTNLWPVSVQQILEETSPVNVGVETTYDSLTRELTIHIELYYTATSLYHENYLNIALIQSHIIGPQLGGSANDYNHMYMLRDLITGQWGDTINPTVEGTFLQRDYIYTVPETVNDIPVIVKDCEVAVFVSETKNEIYSGDVVCAVNGTNRYIGDVSLVDTVKIKRGSAGDSINFSVKAKSALAGEEVFLVTLEAVGLPEDWDASFTFGDHSFSDTAMIMLSQNTEEELIFQVRPGQTAAFVYFRVKFQSLTYPGAPYRYCKFYVISGVTDLVVNGTGGPESEMYDYVFTDGLEHAACSTYAVLSADDFVLGIRDRAFVDIKNIYLNIAWTFPALTISQIEAVKTFMDNGGDLLISGQDIGWDFMSGASGSHSSPEATDFYVNYLLADYISDGTSADNIIYPNGNDEVYGNLTDAFLINIYGQNLFPDNIAARQGADEVFYYRSNDVAAVVKAATQNRKMIYFAAGLEMIGQTAITNQIMSLTYYWFNNSLSTEEFEEKLSGVFAGQNEPNPAREKTVIPLYLQQNGSLVIYNPEGKIIKYIPLKSGESEISIDVHGWKPGIYLYRIIAGAETGRIRKMIVN